MFPALLIIQMDVHFTRDVQLPRIIVVRLSLNGEKSKKATMLHVMKYKCFIKRGNLMFSFDTHFNPYPISRKSVFARNGMVATSQSLASQAGLDILKKGGNAIDAAIATAACLTVVEPTSNGIGGDAFAIIWTKGKLHGINGSGKSPKAVSIEKAKKEGNNEMPKY